MKKIFLIVLMILLTAGFATSAYAQDLPYYFQVDQEAVNVFWNSDGSMSLEYTWKFTNRIGSHEIDFVDVGMPNNNFDIGTVKADVNGAPVSVSTSDYQGNDSGFAIANCITVNVTLGSNVASGKMLLTDRRNSLSEEQHDEPEKQA